MSGPGARPAQRRPKSMPLSVRFPQDLRARVRRFARSRGLEEATAIRMLCAEHLNELELSDDLTRAEQWQLTQVYETWDRIERGEEAFVPAAEIRAIFDRAMARRGPAAP
jgi:predicted DNA-binding protein